MITANGPLVQLTGCILTPHFGLQLSPGGLPQALDRQKRLLAAPSEILALHDWSGEEDFKNHEWTLIDTKEVKSKTV